MDKQLPSIYYLYLIEKENSASGILDVGIQTLEIVGSESNQVDILEVQRKTFFSGISS